MSVHVGSSKNLKDLKCGPSADLLVLVCESAFLLGMTHTRLRITLEPVLPRYSVQGGLV